MDHFLFHTFGAGPVVIGLVLLQSANLGWVVWSRVEAVRDGQREMPDAMRKARTLQRDSLWRNTSRPMVSFVAMMGPALGMALSTVIGSLGMSRLGQALAKPTTEQSQMLADVSSAFQETAASYMIMGGSTMTIVLGALALFLARPIEVAAADLRGGDEEDLVLTELRAIRGALERPSTRRGPDRPSPEADA
jgi:hypothetical protein